MWRSSARSIGMPPRRHQLQRARRAPARRGEHPRYAGRVHQGGPPLRPATAHLARRGEPRLLPCDLAFYNDKHDVDAFIVGLETVYRTFNSAK